MQTDLHQVCDILEKNLNNIDKREYYQYILLLHNRELIPEISNHYIRYNYTEENFEINGSIDEIFKNIRNLNKFC